MKNKRKDSQSEDKLFADIIEQSENAIICSDSDGRIITWNNAAEKLFSYKTSEVIGKPLSSLIPISNTASLHTHTYKARIITKKRENREVSLSTSSLKNADGEILGRSFVLKLMKKRKQKTTSKRTDDFINIASHELRTPLTTIKAYTQILERKFQKSGDKELAQYLEKLDCQINKLTYLIRDLIDIKKIQNKELSINKESFDMNKLIDEIIKELKPLVSDVTIARQGKLATKVHADKMQISQVIINLLTNALKFAATSNTLLIHLKQTKKQTIVGIQDFGIGIDVHEQKKIFERFYRINRDHNTDYPGLGVGLYIASEIIKSHHGKLWVKSSKNEGSVFYFSLPL